MMMIVRRALSLANEVFRQPSTFAALGLAVALIVVRFSSPVIIEDIRMRVFDSYQRAWPREIAASPLVIADIDEKSLGELGQ